MRRLTEIVEHIKKEILNTALDKHVAHEWEIDTNRLSVMKRRNSIPYKEILEWCKKKKHDPIKIFFKG
jgi:hypothetical protein